MDHLNEENIKYSEIFLKHKEFIMRLLLFIFFFADIIIILNLAFRFVVYNNGIIQQLQVENSLATTYIPYEQIHQRQAPAALQLGSVTMISTSPGKYDLVAKLTNSNDKWMASNVNLVATVDGAVIDAQNIIVLPDFEQYVFWFDVESDLPQQAARLEILDVDWERIRDRTPLELLDQLRFTSPQFKNLETGFQVEGQLINNSSHSFWYVGIVVIALRQGEIVGANVTALERVRAGSTREFSVTWPRAISSPQEIRFIPFINVFDDAVYMPLSSFGQPGDPSGVEF